MATVNLPDPELKRRIEGLAALPMAKALEQRIGEMLEVYTRFFAIHGAVNLTANIQIQAQLPCEIDLPTTELRQLQVLRALVQARRRYKRRDKKAEVAEGINTVLAGMLIGGRGH